MRLSHADWISILFIPYIAWTVCGILSYGRGIFADLCLFVLQSCQKNDGEQIFSDDWKVFNEHLYDAFYVINERNIVFIC